MADEPIKDPQKVEDAPELDDEDEQILAEVWAEIAAEDAAKESPPGNETIAP